MSKIQITLYVDEKQKEFLNQLPRSFNFSQWVRDRIDEFMVEEEVDAEDE